MRSKLVATGLFAIVFAPARPTLVAVRMLTRVSPGSGAAQGQTAQEMNAAVGEVGEELQTCSVYFAVISGCVRQQRPDLCEIYLQAAQWLGLLGASSKQTAV